MGVVFQSYALFPHMTVAANVQFGLRMQGIAKRPRTTRAAAALAMVGLSSHAEKRPRQLSGGQQQRVALARALAIEPDVLLLDEPLSALDAKLRQELRVEMRILQRRVGATTVFVTHDQAEALAMADLVAVMQSGRIAQLGTPEEIFERPTTPFVADFVGRSAKLSGVVECGRVRAGPTLLQAPGIPATGPVQIFVRPHRIHLLAPTDLPTDLPNDTPNDLPVNNMLEGTVAALDYTGEVMQVVVDTPSGRVPVDIPTTSGAWRQVQPGQAVRVGWAAADTLCFPVTLCSPI